MYRLTLVFLTLAAFLITRNAISADDTLLENIVGDDIFGPFFERDCAFQICSLPTAVFALADKPTLERKLGKGVQVFANSILGQASVKGQMSAVYVPPYDRVWRNDIGAITYREPASVDYTAVALGYSHFNWLQYVTHSIAKPIMPDGSTMSGGPDDERLDPPIGGTKKRWADDRIYYYDETIPDPKPSNYEPQYNLKENNKGVGLVFLDQPIRLFYAPGDFSSYRTHLVGIKSKDEFDVLNTFEWKSNYTVFNTGQVDLTYADAFIPDLFKDDPSATGGVFDLKENVALEDLPESYKRFLVSLGADNILLSEPVSEPHAFSLMLLGLVSLALARRRAIAGTVSAADQRAVNRRFLPFCETDSARGCSTAPTPSSRRCTCTLLR